MSTGNHPRMNASQERESIKDVTKEYLQRATMHVEQWFFHFAPEGEELLDFIL